jgi:hypothetical protein
MPQPGEARYSDPGWRAELNSGQPGYQAKRRVPRVAADTVFARAGYMIAAWLSTWPPGASAAITGRHRPLPWDRRRSNRSRGGHPPQLTSQCRAHAAGNSWLARVQAGGNGTRGHPGAGPTVTILGVPMRSWGDRSRARTMISKTGPPHPALERITRIAPNRYRLLAGPGWRCRLSDRPVLGGMWYRRNNRTRLRSRGGWSGFTVPRGAAQCAR